jgi:hypothetical protein
VNVPEMLTLAIRKEKLKLLNRPLIADVEERCMQICVARSVSKREAEHTPEATKAMNKEWEKLEKQNAWVLSQVREWSDVRRQAKAKNETAHVGRVFGILVEKGSELPKGTQKESSKAE